MQHLDEGTIHSWLDGALSADESARVEAHVAECPQCATAVAEARGFIAASSRILTALDHVPCGVVPTAAPVKWYNQPAWRAAAAVLVVAVGSLVVARNSDRRTAGSPTMIESGGANQDTVQMVETSSPPRDTALVPASPGATPARKPEAIASVPPSSRSKISSAVAPSGKSLAEADFSGKPVPSRSPSTVPPTQMRDEAVDAAIGKNAAAPPAVAGAVTATTQSTLSSRVPAATILQPAAREEPALKVVGTPRLSGAKVTLYEVAPGDTVTFIEPTNVQLETAVVTAMSAKAAAAVPAVPSVQVQVVNGVTTISWPDATTGNMLRLSGRMPVERLKQIKLRIERERAAAAAKKKP
jgi:hypothetical protein